MNLLLIFELLLFAIMTAAIWLIAIRPRQIEKKASRDPFTELTLRPPGESTRQKIQELDDKINDHFLWIFIAAAIAIGCAVGEEIETSKLGVSSFGFMLAAILVSIAFSLEIRGLVKERANYRLGFDGERQTAQHLTLLIADGFHIFHDVPFENANGKLFNIDHVVVGSTGVFAIETKARSKQTDYKGNQEVNYDGKQLRFPNFSESDSLEQIKAISETLRKELFRRTGENVEVSPILTLPGWWINRQATDTEIIVLNSKEIRKHIKLMPRAGLNEKLFNQIVGFLQEKSEIHPAK
ncbi:MAG TPA: nuclease-related domain-containing protein [Verrucomicrobiae bacterium]|nr:nuclease-related domain-containing protein [Verrucomicrobiae bacterium]